MVTDSTWHQPYISANEDDINQVAVSANDEVLATADDSGDVVLVDLHHHRLLTRLRRHQNVAFVVQFRPGRPRELVSGGYDCRLIHWDILKSRVLSSNDVSSYSDPEWRLPVAFNPAYILCAVFAELIPGELATNQLLVGSENGNLHCFRCVEHRLQHHRVFRAHQLGLTQIRYLRRHAVSGLGDVATNMVVTGGNDKQLKFWNVNSLFDAEGDGGGFRNAVHTVDHGDKINWISECRENQILVCDTSSDATLMQIPL